jgi:hypothetical protein
MKFLVQIDLPFNLILFQNDLIAVPAGGRIPEGFRNRLIREGLATITIRSLDSFAKTLISPDFGNTSQTRNAHSSEIRRPVAARIESTK